jgi:hypothetical protein
VNAATADLQSDIAYGEKSREFLGQSVGFENKLICQTNFPLPRDRLRMALFGNRQPLRTSPEPSKPPLPGRICRQYTALGKVQA